MSSIIDRIWARRAAAVEAAVPAGDSSRPPTIVAKSAPAPASDEASTIVSTRKSVNVGAAELGPGGGGYPLGTDWTAEAAVRSGLKASSWVYRCVSAKARAAASIPWCVQEHGREGAWANVERGHPLQSLLTRPNPHMTMAAVVERLSHHLELTGNAYLTIIRGLRRAPVEIWPINPDVIMPIPDRREYVSGYGLTTSQTVLATEDVIHMQYCDPGNPWVGMSPLQAAARTVDSDVAAANWNRTAFSNRTIPDGLLAFAHDLTEEQFADAVAAIARQWSGALNARKPIVLGNEAKWQPLGISAVDMDFIEGRRLTREEICAVFGVPPVVAGIYSDTATYANAHTARRVFWVDTMIPLIGMVREALDKAFCPPDSGLRVWPNLDGVEVLQQMRRERIESAQKLWSMGVPLDEVNRLMDLQMMVPPLLAGRSYLPTSVTQAELVTPSDGAGLPTGDGAGETY